MQDRYPRFVQKCTKPRIVHASCETKCETSQKWLWVRWRCETENGYEYANAPQVKWYKELLLEHNKLTGTTQISLEILEMWIHLCEYLWHLESWNEPWNQRLKAFNLRTQLSVVHEKPFCVPACKMNDYKFPINLLGNLGVIARRLVEESAVK